MASADRRPLVRLLLPADLAGGDVEAVDHELDVAGLGRRLEVARAELLHDLRFAEPLPLQLGDIVVAVNAR